MPRKKQIEDETAVKKKRGRPRKQPEQPTTKPRKRKSAVKKAVEKIFYSLKGVLKTGAHIICIIGQKGNGKTTACLEYFLEHYCKTGDPFIILKRWDIDIKAPRCRTFFADIVGRKKIQEWTNNAYDNVVYWQGCFYLAKFDPKTGKSKKDPTPCAWTRALNNYEHDNGSQFPPNLYGVFFDEFVTNNELNDEFTQFMLVYDTLKRRRDNFKIFMCGNTINYFSSYWENFGVDVRTMEQGKIYTSEMEDEYGQKVILAVDYCENVISAKEKSVISVFAKNNEKLRMIIDGSWMIGKYPQCVKYVPNEKILEFFIKFHEFVFKVDTVQQETGIFMNIYKSKPERITDEDFVFTNEVDCNYRHIHKLGRDKLSLLFRDLWNRKKVFFDCNLTGNVIDSWYKTMI